MLRAMFRVWGLEFGARVQDLGRMVQGISFDYFIDLFVVLGLSTL